MLFLSTFFIFTKTILRCSNSAKVWYNENRMVQRTHRYLPVLSIAGSDSGGGAGIQADVKTFSALGCFGTTAITAVTAQNTLGVTAIHSIPVAVVVAQIKAVLEDLQPLAIKIGMIHRPDLALAIAETLEAYPTIPIVLDPVMIASSGAKLIEDETIEVLKDKLFPIATLITPNLDEASLLVQQPIKHIEDMQIAAQRLLDANAQAVLVKGGHLQTTQLCNIFKEKNGREEHIYSSYIASHNTHGTGCSLSSAIAAYLAHGHDLYTAIKHASAYIHQAIDAGKDVHIGQGHGALNHFFNPLTLIKQAHSSYEMD